ncbi:MAG: TlpA disulfide reductase family protein [Pseudomonadota bacterium]
MQRNILILSLILILVAVATWVMDDPSMRATDPELMPLSARGNIAPDAPLQQLNGHRTNLRSFAGRPIILHFWATWCAPCVVEFPQLLQLAQQRPGDTIVTISVDADSRKVAAFFEKALVQAKLKAVPDNFILALDPEKTLAQDIFQTVRLPETILIDTDLRMADKIAGPVRDWRAPAMVIQLDALRGRSPDN